MLPDVEDDAHTLTQYVAEPREILETQYLKLGWFLGTGSILLLTAFFARIK